MTRLTRLRTECPYSLRQSGTFPSYCFRLLRSASATTGNRKSEVPERTQAKNGGDADPEAPVIVDGRRTVGGDMATRFAVADAALTAAFDDDGGVAVDVVVVAVVDAAGSCGGSTVLLIFVVFLASMGCETSSMADGLLLVSTFLAPSGTLTAVDLYKLLTRRKSSFTFSFAGSKATAAANAKTAPL